MDLTYTMLDVIDVGIWGRYAFQIFYQNIGRNRIYSISYSKY